MAKIARARSHIQYLGELEAAFNRDHPPSMNVEVLPNGDHVLYADFQQAPGELASTVAADALGNMRAALDIATVQACILRGQQNQKLLKKTFFAVAGSEKDWLGNVDRRMEGADETIRQCVKSFRPWDEDGNALLYALTKLAARDKHVDLIPVTDRPMNVQKMMVSLTHPTGGSVEASVGGYQSLIPTRLPLFVVHSPGKIEIIGPGVIDVRFGFGNVHNVAGAPVIPMLNEMLIMCEQIVKTLELAAKS